MLNMFPLSLLGIIKKLISSLKNSSRKAAKLKEKKGIVQGNTKRERLSQSIGDNQSIRLDWRFSASSYVLISEIRLIQIILEDDVT